MMRKLLTGELKWFCQKIGSGATPTGGDASYKTHGISLIRSQNVLDYFFSKDCLAFIDEKQAKELNNVTLQENDVLVNITGDSVARVCQVPIDVLPARVNQHVAILRANTEKLIPAYLKYYLLNKPNKERLLSLASTGATRKALTKGMLEEFEIEIPDEEGTITQTRIAFILSALDYKIELNRRTNHTLEQMAQTLFKKYFVDDIDPDNLPEGWRWGKLGELMNFRNGKSSPPRSISGCYPVYGSNGVIGNCDIFNSNECSIVIGRVGSYCGSVYYTLGKAFITDNAIIGEPANANSSSFCFLLLLSLELNNYRGGSGQPLINQSVLSNIKTIIPNRQIIEEFESKVFPLYEMINSNSKESISNSNIRDILLPKLMSGEIKL
jgi:type I restriction enzyme S subunit